MDFALHCGKIILNYEKNSNKKFIPLKIMLKMKKDIIYRASEINDRQKV